MTKKGVVLKHDFKEALKVCFPNKSSEQIDALLKTAEDEQPSSDHTKIEYKSLFNEVLWKFESNGKKNNFLLQ